MSERYKFTAPQGVSSIYRQITVHKNLLSEISHQKPLYHSIYLSHSAQDSFILPPFSFTSTLFHNFCGIISCYRFYFLIFSYGSLGYSHILPFSWRPLLSFLRNWILWINDKHLEKGKKTNGLNSITIFKVITYTVCFVFKLETLKRT